MIPTAHNSCPQCPLPRPSHSPDRRLCQDLAAPNFDGHKAGKADLWVITRYVAYEALAIRCTEYARNVDEKLTVLAASSAVVVTTVIVIGIPAIIGRSCVKRRQPPLLNVH